MAAQIFLVGAIRERGRLPLFQYLAAGDEQQKRRMQEFFRLVANIFKGTPGQSGRLESGPFNIHFQLLDGVYYFAVVSSNFSPDIIQSFFVATKNRFVKELGGEMTAATASMAFSDVFKEPLHQLVDDHKPVVLAEMPNVDQGTKAPPMNCLNPGGCPLKEQATLLRLKQWVYQTDHFVGKRLDDVQRYCGLNPLITATVCVFTLLGWMIFNPKLGPIISKYICCCTYPLTESITALINRGGDSASIWCVYWVIYNCISALDFLCDISAFYWPIKTVLLMCFFLPPIHYITVIYDAWLMPMIEIVYGDLRIETLRWSHPLLLSMLEITYDDVGRWDQQQLKAHLDKSQSKYVLVSKWIR